MKEKLHFCGVSTAINGNLKSSRFSRFAGFVVVFLFLFISVESWGQNVGDYKSNPTAYVVVDGVNTYYWTNPANWLYFNGADWVTPTYYPGNPNNPESVGAVEILETHTITLDYYNNLPVPSDPIEKVTVTGKLVLDGRFKPKNVQRVEFSINTPFLKVTDDKGIIQFLSKVLLKLPTNSIIEVMKNEPYKGLMVAANSCNNNQQILVGDIVIAFCEGTGHGALNFDGLMTLKGSLSSIYTVSPINCSNYTSTLTGNIINLGNVTFTSISYSWNVTNPSNVSSIYNGQSFILDLTISGTYNIIFTLTAVKTNDETIEKSKNFTITSGDAVWNNGVWGNGIFPGNAKSVVIDGTYDTSIDGSLSACAMTVNSGKTLTIGPGDYVDIQRNITNNGVIDVMHEGSLRQRDSLATYTKGTDAQNYVRKTTDANILNYSYIYWSSPVSGETFNSVFAANRQNRIYQYLAANYMDLFSGKYTQIAVTPDGYDDNGNDWGTASGTITPGKGYIAMAAGSPTYFHPDFKDTPIASAQSVVFDGGQMNTGNITVPVSEDLYHWNNYDTVGDYTAQTYIDKNTNLNLLGNPYPSAIDIKELYKDNSSILTGTFYFWEHNTGLEYNIGPSTYDFSNLNYFTVTTNGTTVSSTKYEFIASGQGFMANILNDGNVVFNNSMRVTFPNTSFKRMAATSSSDRLWLNLTQENGVSRQLMVGFHSSTSDNFAANEDGVKRFTKNELDFYSIIPENDSKFVIQMLAPFEENKIIPLGINVNEAGIYKIGIDQTEGVFAGMQKVFVQDLYTGKVYDLSQGAFTFETAAGENINDRFVLRFTPGKAVLGVEETNWENLKIYPNPSKGLFNINYFDIEPLEIEIYDLSGKQLKKTTGTNMIDLSGYAKGIYFAKIQTKTNSVTKKLVVE